MVDFRIVNVDKKEVLPVDQFYSNMDEVLLQGFANSLVPLLTVPNLRRVRISQSGVDKARALNRSSPLVALPQELVDAITDEVSDFCPLLSLAVACSYFWRTLLPRVREAIIAYEGPWAGDRLVCIDGDAFGLPPTCSDFEPDEPNRKMPDRCHLLDIKTTIKRSLDLGELFLDRHYGQKPPFMPIFSSEDYELYRRLIAMLRYDTQRPGVLRNLSKRQYVLDTTLAESTWRYSLGDAVTVHSEWTDNFNEDRNGEWAGDRFDIRTEDDITGEWIDRSNEIVDLLDEATKWAVLNRYRWEFRAWV
ncbi:hypothetical protein F4679DRAFT_597339 [Xylaria curta]|nr:hypothetical protein F4679DRAFT_597339 [Xylaria curta]